MGNRYHLEALDRTLRDLMKTVNPLLEHEPFGGKVIVIAGDFRQTLPISPRASRAQIVDLTLPRSSAWPAFRTFALEENMRILRASQTQTEAMRSEESTLPLLKAVAQALHRGGVRW